MKLTAFRRIFVCLTLLSPLVLASCASSDTSHSAVIRASQECSSCVNFTVQAWRFTPEHGELLPGILKVPANASVQSLSSGTLQVIKADQVADIPGILHKEGNTELLMDHSGITVRGQSLPVSISGAYGEFSAWLLPAWQTYKLPARAVSFKLSAALPAGTASEAMGPRGEVSGRVLIPDGGALLNIQPIGGSYVVWLIRANYSV